MQTEKPTPATRPFMSGPELNATPAELLPSTLSLNEARRRPSSFPSGLYLNEARQTAGKNRNPPSLPHLLLHHFLHSSDGFRGAVLRHTTRLGGPPSPPDTGQAAWCFTNLAWPDGASCRPKPARGSATRR